MTVPAKVKVPGYILPVIVLSQFAGTSVWFAGNAILPALQSLYHLPDKMVGTITTAVQLGFISGTLLFALLTVADRFSPVKVFMLSSLLAALFNLLVIYTNGDAYSILTLRFLTGFFLAGVYPVGMKIAADWYAQGLGKALGFLVGALVAGKAIPHLLKGLGDITMWKQVMITTSVFAAAGGIMVGLFLKNGPHRTKGTGISFKNITSLFKNKSFKAASLGYFGHMWELYTFWAFVPVMLKAYNLHTGHSLNISLWSFLIIGIGTISCIAGGYISKEIGSAKVAFFSLVVSGICCLLSPLFFLLPAVLYIAALLIWSCFVIADSPQFSTLVSQTAESDRKGTALTIVTSIGFGITIISIEVMNYLLTNTSIPSILFGRYSSYSYMLLSIGPIAGIIGMRKLLKKAG